ncbi:MAG: PQQ-binding-like beta-propeller repeat protein [Verrucomicrobiales bacterium]|nr:PQQ-binding-like beta-propeller repeat protein [Verrucomicrobiales bacterium]
MLATSKSSPRTRALWRATLLSSLLLSNSTWSLSAADWPNWRGPQLNGISSESHFPTEWSKTKNVRWRVALPERGNSTPIVWGDRIFITQAIEKEHRRTVMCFRRSDGKLLWQKGTTYAHAEKTHGDNPYCAASPATDGSVVVAAFGPAGVFAYDFEGKELWQRDLGKQEHEWGYASSPVLDGDRCYVFQGPGKGAKLLALQKRTGATLWENPLPEPNPTERFDGFKGNLPGRIGSFSTPVLVQVEGRSELILSLPESLQSFDPSSGKVLWHAGGLNPLVYTTPVVGEGTVLAIGGFFGSVVAVKPGGDGDVTSKRLWYEQRAKKNRIGSAVIKDGHFYILNSDGIAECVELATGKSVWTERLKGPGAKADSWSSFTLAGDKLYTVNQSGDAFVVRASPKFELIATNSVGEYTNSSFAHSDGELFLRTYESLWCFSAPRTSASAR